MLSYRPLNGADWPRILDIQHECYEEKMRESLTALQSRWIVSPGSCIVAENRAGLIGYALSHPWQDHHVPALDIPLHGPAESDLLYVHDVAISAAARRSGAANILVNGLISIAESRNFPAMALTSVQGSARFWERHGFQVAEYAGDLTGYGEEAVYMKKHLPRHDDAA